MANNTQTGLNILKESGYYDKLKEPFYAHALWTNIGFFYRIDREFKQEYFDRLKKIFADLVNDKDFAYRYFRPEDKVAVKRLLKSNSWESFEMAHVAGGIKRRIRRLASAFFPTYKKINELSLEIEELKIANEVLISELNNLQ